MFNTRSGSQNDGGGAVELKCTVCAGLLDFEEVADGQTICDSCTEEAQRVKSNAAGLKRVQARGGGMVQLADTRMTGNAMRSDNARDDRAGSSGARDQQAGAALGEVEQPRLRCAPSRLIEEEAEPAPARAPAGIRM